MILRRISAISTANVEVSGAETFFHSHLNAAKSEFPESHGCSLKEIVFRTKHIQVHCFRSTYTIYCLQIRVCRAKSLSVIHYACIS